jgi:hypothetical protein
MVRIIGFTDESSPPTQKAIEIVAATPEERARNAARSEAFWRNTEWLSQQWDRLLPAARGKYVAVANQQEFVAQTRQEAKEWIAANHPDDPGPIIHYVSPHKELRTRAY